jgi:hypothetical protein
MRWQDRFRQACAEWMLLTLYERFEQVVIRFLNERPVWGAASNTISGRDGRETDARGARTQLLLGAEWVCNSPARAETTAAVYGNARSWRLNGSGANGPYLP